MIRAVALGLLLCAATQAQVEDRLLKQARTALNSGFNAINKLEPDALLRDAQFAARQGGALRLRLRSGRQRSLEDSKDCGALDPVTTVQCFRYVAHIQTAGLFVVIAEHYEGGFTLLVDDRSGQILRLPLAIPAFSPSGQAMVLCMSDVLNDGFGVELWQRRENQFQQVWREAPYANEGQLTTYSVTQWNVEDDVVLRSVTEPPPPVTHEFHVKRQGSDWQVVP